LADSLLQWEGVLANDLTVCEIRSRHSLIHKKFADTMIYILCTLTTEKTGFAVPPFLDAKGKE